MSEALFINSVYNGNIHEISLIARSSGVSMHNSRDSRGMTALHIASLNGNLSVLKFLIDFSKLKYKNPELLFQWVNEFNEEGFLAAHYAAFRGYLEILKILINEGTDITATNSQGLTLMHVAAQGDHPRILVYLKSLGMKIDQEDNKGGLPLHWACYLGCETSASILLAWKGEINKQDSDGHTPLHLAAQAGNTRIIRNLLVKGAKRNIKVAFMQDNTNETALQIALKTEKDSLKSLLKDIKWYDECGLKPPLRPPQPTYLSYLSFLILFTGGTVLNFLLRTNGKNFIAYLYGAFILSTNFVFIVLFNKDPGYIKKSSSETLLALYECYDSFLVCPDCEVYRPARSRHCQTCDKCVEKFDHHCPWVNNCIGGKNLGWFFSFINLVWLSLIFTAVLNIYAISTGHEFKIISLPTEIEPIVSVAFAVCSLAFAAPLSILLIVHYKNFSINRTTNERFAKGADSRNESMLIVSFDGSRKSCVKNCVEMCCNTVKHPRINEEKLKQVSLDTSYFEEIEHANYHEQEKRN